MTRIAHTLLLLLTLIVACGCDSDEKSTSAPAGETKITAARQPKIPGPGEIVIAADLHVALARFNPDYNRQAKFQLGLKGDIVDVTIKRCQVSDLRGLTNLRLSVFEASHNPIEDLRPLKDMPIKKLYLVGTKVRDLSPLKGMPLNSLWLNDTPVEDIGPLKDTPLVSLTLAGTRVSDLSPLPRGKLERLHIGGTPVSDLTPLAGMQLTRLVFDPRRIKKGLDVVRNMTTLKELGLDLNTRMRPEEFWKLYDSDKLGAQR